MSWSSNATDHLSGFGNNTAHIERVFFQTPVYNYDKVTDFSDQQSVFLVLLVHIILITGIPGNIITLLVLQKKSMHDNFVSIFLSTMCLVDLWCLITGFGVYWWMSVTDGYDLREDSYIACLYHWFTTLIGLQVSEWLIVIISACRIHVIVTRSKKHRHDTCTVAVLLMLVMLAVIMIPGYFMVKDSLDITYRDGDIVQCEFMLGADLRIVYFTLTLLLPPLVVIIENAAMHYFYRNSMPVNMRLRPTNIAANQRMKMLIVMTDIMFFVTSIPPLLFHEISRSMFPPDNSMAAASRKFEMVLMFCVLYGGFAFNIVIYCCFGRRFRAELKTMLLKPVHNLGFCRKLNIRDTGSIRRAEPIPFSVYTQSSAANQCEIAMSQSASALHANPNLEEQQQETYPDALQPTV